MTYLVGREGVPPKVRRVGFRTLGGFCVPVLFFFGLSAGACRGLLGVRVWGSYLGSWWIVGDTRIGVGWRFCGGCGSPRLVSSACQ